MRGVCLKYFVEVSSLSNSFEKKLHGVQGINAPNSTRYLSMFSQVKKNDKVLHYFTSIVNKGREWRSAFVGESIINSDVKIDDKKIMCELTNVKLLPKPIKLSSVKKQTNISPKLAKALKMSMQSYLFEIEESDYLLIKHMAEDNSKI